MANRIAVRDAAGAGAATTVHVPAVPGMLHASPGAEHAVSQQTRSTQGKPTPHCDPLVHAPPSGTGVLVGVAVGVAVGVCVGVHVGVAVGVCVGVEVGVAVAVRVAVLVDVAVAVPVLLAVRVAV